MTESEFTARVDVLDLIITVLKDHEKTLSESVERIELAVERINAERRKRICYPIG